MMPILTKRYVELSRLAAPWFEFDGDKMKLRDDAPQEVIDAVEENRRYREKHFIYFNKPED